MHVGVVVSHPDFLATAGVRIRYKRLEAAFAAGGDKLTVVSIEQVADQRDLAFDVYLFSKTYNAFALIAMRRLRSAGKLVGFDLFDDYFSQLDDVRLVFFRGWLASSQPHLDFAICSTPVLARFLSDRNPAIPTLVLPDVVTDLDLHRVEALSQLKIQRARVARRLDVLWFGIGDNPFFEVGLVDLVAYGAELTRISRRNWDLRLKVLTNDAALDRQTLHLLAGLDCPYVIESWSEEAEVSALDAATVCFLPVNAQSFSRSKSLNRAVSALAAGCLVLSPGFPLYADLGEAVHMTAEDLLDCLEATGDPASGTRLVESFGRLANAYANARSFVEFIGSIPKAAPAPSVTLPDIAIVHGVELDVQAHKGAKKLGAISVGSPLTEAKVNFDLALDIDGAYVMRVLVRPNTVPYLKLHWQRRFDDAPTQNGYLMRTISELGLTDLPRHVRAAAISGQRIAAVTFIYRSVLEHTIAVCAELLDSFTFHLSDRSRIARFGVSSTELLAS